ncbi:NADP-dependent oxidoreductase [Kibdelosporangium phytohabitans]|uniref:NADP-dependent oxidoreductase n=1 Tax=Kibdelosporangium phytohabitans TaxID=860235 RepID=UPI001A047C32|nr:NADP-dependent oxidoreductase [Kibdelosporangium phytohabitans]MBE1468166.1 NADPH:quinone reductase-like Zn-dependent oxidoreductase [Kibdelosporangium phytohabitans]
MKSFGGASVLGVDEVDEAVAGAGEVLLRVVGSSVNPVDVKTRDGVFAGTGELPATLGWDLAGVVIEPGDSGLEVGARVIAMSHQLATGRGTWADVVALPHSAIAPAPRSISLVEAGTLPLVGLTALQTLEWLAVAEGERLLITGAAGAVGGVALQIAHAKGVKVDALVSSAAHIEFARNNGAELVTTDRAELKAYDAVFDTFGAFVTDAVVDEGRYASIATQAGPVPDLSARNVRTTVNQVHESGTDLRKLVSYVDRGAVRPRIDSSYGVQDVQAAHRRFEQGGLAGKVAITL